ncbi:MAG: hypothetical protein Q8R24_06275 [Legionellaceae bacterium]|nr:hypothetical protein [Legionellaceae bacterium]
MKNNYVRDSAQLSVTNLLDDLPRHLPLDAIRMVDREIGGLLGNPGSPCYNAYRTYALAIFPSGLEATSPGRDIILILNSKETVVMRRGVSCTLSLPNVLQNPEKGVAQIIGIDLARALFKQRTEIFQKLQHGDTWQDNIDANNQAIMVLNDYDPYPPNDAKEESKESCPDHSGANKRAIKVVDNQSSYSSKGTIKGLAYEWDKRNRKATTGSYENHRKFNELENNQSQEKADLAGERVAEKTEYAWLSYICPCIR